MDKTNQEETLLSRLSVVQELLKAPKAQRNTFGNYNYRNCEDILEAAKPLLAQRHLVLTLSDELVLVGERYYIKATAQVAAREDASNTHAVTAYAREEETKKGMDGSQITGAASSYARKYALNGLFLIDDTKDSDSDELAKDVPTTARKTERTAVDEHMSHFSSERPGANGHATDAQRDEITRVLMMRGCATPEDAKIYIENKLGEKTPLTVGAASRVL